jgi:hypothetical protein
MKNVLTPKEAKSVDVQRVSMGFSYAIEGAFERALQPFPRYWWKTLNDSMETKEMYKFWESAPETKKYFETLVAMVKELGLGWEDVHTGNIMMDRDELSERM